MEYPRTFDLAYWVNERDAMRQRRDAGMPAPWSADPVMQSVRYCNVHREDDKVTRYVRSSGVYSGASVPVYVVVLARMVNRIETLRALEQPVLAGGLQAVKAILKERRKTQRIWGNAYTISTCGKTMDKVDYVIDHVVQVVDRLSWAHAWTSLQACHTALMRVDGLGSFLAAQVVADLKNTPGHPLARAVDWSTWCAPGPGSLKGLAAYYGRPSSPSRFQADIAKCYEQTMPLVAEKIKPIHMQDFQNCLCEFSKYTRVQAGGRARNTYPPNDRVQKDTRYDDDSCD